MSLKTWNHGTVEGGAPSAAVPSVRFGLISDLHYADTDPDVGLDRYFRDGTGKLAEAVAAFNRGGVDFVLMNGDYVNQTASAADLIDIEVVFSTCNCPRYHVLGNHEGAAFTKAEFIAGTAMTDEYYSFDMHGVRFIVLDSNYNADSDGAGYTPAGGLEVANSYINPAQRTWLSGQVSGASGTIVVFCHRQLGASDVSNAAAVRTILETAANDVFVFGGHLHNNALVTTNGINYYGMEASTDSPSPQNAFAFVTVTSAGEIVVEGKGGQTSYL